MIKLMMGRRLSSTTLSPLKVNYILPSGKAVSVQAKNGQNLLELAHENSIELEGACEASLACSTCHLIVDNSFYPKLDEPSDEENDMLDLAFGLTETYSHFY